MNCLFRNIKGLGNPVKRRIVREVVSNSRLEIFCLEETKIKLSLPRSLRSIFPPKTFKVFSKGAIGALGGIIIGFNNVVYDVIDHSIGKFSITVKLRRKADD